MAGGTELCKAYVQIVPSTEGMGNSITETLTGEGDKAGTSAGQSAGSKFIETAKKLIVAAGIGKVISKAMSEGAEYQQAIGGVETIFKGSADVVKQYAKDAYQTAGISANEYMSQVTSFSASLLQSLGGDTAKAAESANQAVIDMSDNANKFGTDISSIQNAYQGFAKQNYTMLDNLKLGYGGTKSEMERLLKDAEALTGVKYDINNLDDVYSAIHVVQQELGITGTTAQEAGVTVSGSVGSMKAAWENLLAYMAAGEDISGALTALFDSAFNALTNNVIPMFMNILKAVPTIIQTVALEWIPNLMESGIGVIEGLIAGLENGFPSINGSAAEMFNLFVNRVIEDGVQLIEVGFELIGNLVEGIINNIPGIIGIAQNMMVNLVTQIVDYGPNLLNSGMELIKRLASGLVNALPQVIAGLANVLGALIRGIGPYLPTILQQGVELILSLLAGFISLIPKIPSYIGQIWTAFKGGFGGIDWGQLGRNIIDGVVQGIKNGASKIASAAKNAASAALNAAKNFLGIKSPSRVFRKEVGAMVGEGFALGVEDKENNVESAVHSLSLSAEKGIGTMSASVSNGGASISDVYNLLSSLLPEIADKDIVLDDGTLVGKMTNKLNSSLNTRRTMEARGLA